MLTLLLGGARSGKSALAVELARRHAGPVTFVATATPLDADMGARIGRHRAERPAWPTIEEPDDLAGALARCGDTLAVVDCLTVWVANLLHRGDDDGAVDAASAAALDVAVGREAPTVVVSNEVGLGIHPATDVGRRFRDLLGRVNQQWAGRADTALLLVAGRALRLDDPWAVVAR